MNARLVAIAALAVGCGNRTPKPPPDDAANDDGGDLIELAGRYDRKCASGDLESCRHLGLMYADGSAVSPDPKRATQLFIQACNGGNVRACFHLGLALSEGLGTERQPVRAIEAYQKACDGNVLEACRNLGMLLRDGRGVPLDLNRAAGLLDKSCKARIPQACTAAGDLDAVRAIKGGNANYREMFAHYKLGCDAGDPTACRQLGVAYLEGKGLSKSPSAAAVWLERACLPDDPIACRMLGEMKLSGTGVPRDVERAKQLLTRACDNHDDEACRALKSASEVEADDAGVGDGGVSPPTDAGSASPPG